jgi:hypothetical protein
VGEAIERIGRAKFLDSWTGKELRAQRRLCEFPTFEGSLIHHWDKVRESAAKSTSDALSSLVDEHLPQPVKFKTPITREDLWKNLKAYGEQLASESEHFRPQYEAAEAEWNSLREENELERDRLEWVVNLIGQKGRDGQLSTYLRPVDTATRAGNYVEVPPAFWETENLISNRLKEGSVEFQLSDEQRPAAKGKPQRYYIFFSRESIDIQLRNLDAAVGPHEDEALYYSIYMQLMRRAIQHLNITATDQPKKSVLEAYFDEYWPATVKPSERLRKAMATLVRDPERQEGRGLKPNG